MTLVNIKCLKSFSEPANYLRILLAFIFLTAGIFRIFNPSAASLELVSLGLSHYFSWPIIILEIVAGLLLLFNYFTRSVYYSLILFMVLTLFWALIFFGEKLVGAAGELFVFNITPTDFFLHAIFLLLIITLLRLRKE